MTISNNPPVFEAFSLHVEELMIEASNFLDGKPIENQGQADDVGKLLDAIRKVKKDADGARAEEKKPFDEGARSVQTKWKPLLERCDTVADVAKRALTPWLQKLEDEQRAEANRKAELAEAARLAALAAEREASNAPDLDAAERAKEAIKFAEKAERAAAKAGNAKPQAVGGSKAIGLRISWTAEVTDPVAFARWLWTARRDDYLEWLQSMADQMARTRPAVPGVLYHEQRGAV